MTSISARDRDILRQRAQLQLEYAHSPRNDQILAQWRAQAEGRRARPPVRLLFSNFRHEVITPRLQCEGTEARRLEAALLATVAGRECFDDDTPVPTTFNLRLRTHVRPFGLEPHITRAEGPHAMGYHIDPVIHDLATEADRLCGGSFGVDREAMARERELAESVFGDLLPVRCVMGSLPGAITNPLVALMGMEAYYLAMYDCPGTLHAVMESATRVYEQYYAFLEAERLLLPTNGMRLSSRHPRGVLQQAAGGVRDRRRPAR